MRESVTQKNAPGRAPSPAGAREVPYDPAAYFESYYKLSIEGTPDDHSTVDLITDMEIRFHYNATENAILHAMAKLSPPPARALSRAWTAARRRQRLRHLDIGTGAGHWIEFCRDVLLAAESIAVEITPTMAAFLEGKYAGQSVRVLQTDVAAPDFTADALGGPVDLVTAVGVMFHIVDDAQWEAALRNIAAVMKPGALLFIGGEFGPVTRNVQFHGRDDFASWRDYDAAARAGELRVNKRVRALPTWQQTTAAAGLEIVDLVRSDREPAFTTPENDVLVLRKREG